MCACECACVGVRWGACVYREREKDCDRVRDDGVCASVLVCLYVCECVCVCVCVVRRYLSV